MNRELADLLQKLRESLVYERKGVELTKNELRLLMKYINELEIEITGDYEDINKA